MASTPDDAAALGETPTSARQVGQRVESPGGSSFAGQWAASALTEVWKFAAWPAACGPKPAPEPDPPVLSLVNEESGELSFSGLGRSFRTNQCWEQYPGLRRVAHSRSADAWSSKCKSAEGDPRRASIHTTVTAFGDTLLKFRETGNYEFHLGGAKCSAQVTRTRSFSRDLREVNVGGTASGETASRGSASIGSAAPPVAVDGQPRADVEAAELARPSEAHHPDEDAVRPAAVAAERPVHDDCEPSGEAREIRLPRPIHWLQPGASYKLSPVIADASGCVVAKGPFTYAVDADVDAVHVGPRSGRIQISAQAAEGKYSVIIRSGQLREVIEVPVITREGLSALLNAPSDAPLPAPSTTAAAPEILDSSLVVAADDATPRKWWFTGLAGAVILGLGTFGLRLLRAGSRPTVPPPPPKAVAPAVVGPLTAVTLPSATTTSTSSGVVSSSSLTGASAVSVVTPQAAVASGQLALTVVPPAANQPQPPTTRTHTEPLQRRSNPPPKPRAAADTTHQEGRACPQCGTRYTDGSLFCGVDGAKLPERVDPSFGKRS